MQPNDVIEERVQVVEQVDDLDRGAGGGNGREADDV